MKLYGALASPYVARVYMLARLKGIDLPLEPAPGGMGSDEYKALNLTGKIPALQTDSGVIPECEIICEYLEDVHPDPAMLPADPMLRAHSRMASRITDLYIAPHNSGLIQERNAANRDQAKIDTAAANFADAFRYLSHYMGPGPFVAGDTPSIGDCAVAPFIILLKQTVFPHFDEIPDPTESDARIKLWWEAMQSHNLCAAAITECDVALEKFLQYLMERLAARH